MFESTQPGKLFQTWIDDYKNQLHLPALGSKCILAMPNMMFDKLVIFYGIAKYIDEDDEYYTLQIASGRHQYSKNNQLVFATRKDFDHFKTAIILKFGEKGVEIKEMPVMESSMTKASHNPLGPKFKGYWQGKDPNPPKPGMGVGGCEESEERGNPTMKKPTVNSTTITPRNYVVKNAGLAGRAGPQTDRKKAAKQGDVKHKGNIIPVDENFFEWAMRQSRYRDYISKPEIYEAARREYKNLIAEAGSPAQQAAIAINMKRQGVKPKRVEEFRNDHSPVAWHENYYGGLDEDEGDDLQPGEYYIWRIYFDDGSDKRIKVTSGEFDPYKYYAKQNKTVINVDYNWQPHRN
jgi:hypothetical protein